MLIRNATSQEIELALEKANEKFNGNLKFKRFEFAGYIRNGEGLNHYLTLTVKSSRGAGGRIGQSGKHITAACWHAYGTFIDFLPNDAEIYISRNGKNEWIRPGSRWVDWNIGSDYYPLYYSDACECNK